MLKKVPERSVEGEEGSRVWFVYSGMGTQWAGMGRQLLTLLPVFKVAMFFRLLFKLNTKVLHGRT